ncbi:MAG: DUF4349 domain-containing protein [Lachnospiraceae bacterium]|nr:DUF4349 domain-containing protein [Lachnospiraceae bacterium]
MKKRNGKALLITWMTAAALLAGCGSGKGADNTAYEPIAENSYATQGAYDTGAGEYYDDDIYSSASLADEAVEAEEAGAAPADAPQVQDTSRKLIRNVNMNVETENFDELLATVESRVKALGGYIEDSSTYNGSSYYGNQKRDANMTIRIPADKLDEFLSHVSSESNVISKSENVSDVTLQYVDMESHKEALLAEQESLLRLMEQAETVEDIITLESRLTDVRYQIESMEARLRAMDNQVTYSTVYLYVNEVTKLTPVKEQTVWEKIATGFTESLYEVGDGILNFVIGIIINLPHLIIWAIVICIIVLIVKKIIKKRKQKKEALYAMYQTPMMMQPQPGQLQPNQSQPRPNQPQAPATQQEKAETQAKEEQTKE